MGESLEEIGTFMRNILVTYPELRPQHHTFDPALQTVVVEHVEVFHFKLSARIAELG